MDQSQRGAGQRGNTDRSGKDERPGGMNAFDSPEARHGAHQHHPLDAEVEDARALCQQLSECGEEQRRPEQDAGGDHHDNETVVHHANLTR